ncbi:MAG: metallophosphoesterase [Clostridiales bacterium]|nr:metallophosphoesterase [Clostridiales bacterium]
MIYAIILLFFIIFIFIFCYYQNNKLDITKYSIESNEIENRIKIVHLSDFHSKPFKRAVCKTKELNPDLIMITGDYINDKGKNKAKMLETAKELSSIAPVFYITGNHERRLSFFNELMDELSSAGFHVLLNKRESILVNNSVINILGLDENQADFKDYKERKKGFFKYADKSPYINSFENSK